MKIIQATEEYARELIANKIPPSYCYHDITHTEEVVVDSLEIAAGMGMDDPEQLEILQVAAWLHDVGYTISYSNHEEKSSEIAINFLKITNYPEEKIKCVVSCIKATKMPQSPKSLVEQILCDGDLANLGKETFFLRDALIRKEISQVKGQEFTDQQWREFSLNFVQNHQYHTSYAQRVLQKKKEENLIKVRMTDIG